MAKAKQEETPVEQQQTIPGAFPEIDEELEKLIATYEMAKSSVTKVTDKKTAAYDLLKEAMRRKGLKEYRCYRTRFAATFDPGDPKVKTRVLKEDDPSPFRPDTGAAA